MQVFLYKRAQILAADLWAAYGMIDSIAHPYGLHDIAELTMFADYRVPQASARCVLVRFVV
jgi:Potential Queuosine, Q, salvage protein family